MKTIDIYYASVCGKCKKAIEYFREQGLSFNACAVAWDHEADDFVDSENARSMQERCGEKVDFVPQIFIDEVFVRPARFAAAC